MAYYLQSTPDDQEQFASNSGYGEVITWAQKLPDDTAPNLRHLIWYGWCDQVAPLSGEIITAIKKHPPTGYVLKTVEGMEKMIIARSKAKVIIITDGMGPEDIEPDYKVG